MIFVLNSAEIITLIVQNKISVVEVRAILDEAGAYELKVLPCTSEMLHSTVSQALNTKEQDWDKPKPSRADMGNANWGSLRTVLFSGLG